MGTLNGNEYPISHFSSCTGVPDEVTESEHQNCHAGELDSIGERAVESLNVIAKHRRQGQRAKALGEGNEACGHDSRDFPSSRPVERVIGVLGRLRYQDAVTLASTFDEMVRANIRHHLGAGQDFDMELLLDGAELLHSRDQLRSDQRSSGRPYRFIALCLHG
jgi:hypothetical protein